MPLTTDQLKRAISMIHTRIDDIGAEMNELDGKLGDGDLGVTLINGFNNLKGISDTLPSDVGMAFLASAKAVTAVSGSSFGTLMATALMAAAKVTKGRDNVSWDQIAELLQAAQDAMIKRGGASLGDKTMLDVIQAMILATKGQSQPKDIHTLATAAVVETIRDFRGKPNKIGRARVYAEKSVGLDDPGMVAILRMLECLR